MRHDAHGTVTSLIEQMKGCLNNPGKFDRLSDELALLTKAYMVPDIGENWGAFGLTRMQVRIASVLHSRMGKLINRDALMNAMYFDDPNGGASPKTLDVQLHRLRIALEGEYNIDTIHGQGYRMTSTSKVSA